MKSLFGHFSRMLVASSWKTSQAALAARPLELSFWWCSRSSCTLAADYIDYVWPFCFFADSRNQNRAMACVVGTKHWMHPTICLNSVDWFHTDQSIIMITGHSGTDGTVVLGIFFNAFGPGIYSEMRWYGYGSNSRYTSIIFHILPTSSNLLLFLQSFFVAVGMGGEVFILDVAGQSGDVDPFAIEPLSHPLAPWLPKR